MCALSHVSQPYSWISWTNVAIGVWLIASTFLLQETGTGVAENLVAGSFTALAALVGAGVQAHG